jgi:DNA mismatch repair ATPase MutS
VTETKAIQEDLSRIRYCITIKGNRVRVSTYDGEDDYSSDVEATFEKFKQGSVESYAVKFNDWPDMSYVEARILEIVARLNPATFQALDDYSSRHRSFLDPLIGAFDREVQFYIAYLEFISTLKSSGLHFCYPDVSTQSKEIHVEDTFDLALANKLVQERAAVTCNDFYLTDPERIIVVTGPNQGGKTTFARTFGQLHYLASLGYPVPGRVAQLFLPDRLFTHFEREETIQTLMGKLEDELSRIHDILEQATGNSMVIMNESFTSTTLHDALFLGKEILGRIIRLDLLCVYVTFVDELASLSRTIVSMSSTVVPENPTIRTYKVVRKQADGLAYASALAEKYGLTYQSLRRRIAR